MVYIRLDTSAVLGICWGSWNVSSTDKERITVIEIRSCALLNVLSHEILLVILGEGTIIVTIHK